MPRLTVFWLLHSVAMVVLAIGVWANVSIWLQGHVEGRARPSLAFALAAGWRRLRQAGFGRVLRALVHGLSHRRLREVDPARWLAHTCLMGAFAAMAALSTLTGFVQEILIGLLHVRHPLALAVASEDTPMMALANETLGVIMVLSMVFIALRRYVRRPSQLRTATADTTLVVLLVLTLLGGFPVEALRLLMDQVPPEIARYSYVGYLMALPFRSLDWPWQTLHYWVFIAHSTLASAFLAYIPFSKLWHAVAGPIAATVNHLKAEVPAS